LGQDNDITCVKIAALNMMVNSMKGEVAWMDSLSMEHYRSYHINLVLHENHFLPVLTITGKNETLFIKHYQRAMQEMKEEKKPDVLVNKKGQIQLF
jgi:hypothetical protein